MTALKSLSFFIVAPVMVAGYIPLTLFRQGPQINTGLFAHLALPLWLAGWILIVWSFWNFLHEGSGTPAPIDPPKELVVTGFYHCMRNPMYTGILAILAGYFLWFGYGSLLLYGALVFLAFNSFVVYYEEPTLKRKFGSTYEEYVKRVPRWLPRCRRLS